MKTLSEIGYQAAWRRYSDSENVVVPPYSLVQCILIIKQSNSAFGDEYFKYHLIGQMLFINNWEFYGWYQLLGLPIRKVGGSETCGRK